MKKLVGRLLAVGAAGLLAAGAFAAPAQAVTYDQQRHWTGSLSACIEWQNSIATGSYARILQSCHEDGNGYAFVVAYRTS